MIFVDTGAFIARNLARDSYHAEAGVIWRQLASERLVTSNHVVSETLTYIGRRASYSFAAECGERLHSSKIEILYSTEEDEKAALKLFSKFAGQQVSFTDCVSFALMHEFGIATAFTFDRHFIQAGFRVIGVKS